jgi:hypothetical protein
MLMQQPAVRFNFLDMIPVAGFPVGSVWYVSRDTGIKSVEDLKHPAQALHYAGVAASGRDLSGLLAFDLLGVEVHVTFGYTSGGASTLLAFERRESNFDMQTTSVYVRLHGQAPAGPQWEAYKIALGTRGALDMIIWLHADAPKELVDELSRGFREMGQDPEYQMALAKQTGGYPIIVGQEVLKPLVRQTFDVDPGVRKWLYGWLEQKYNIPPPRK